MVQGSIKEEVYEEGDIVRYTGYEGDLINEPNKKPVPNKYFMVKSVDMDWGVVDHGTDTVGIGYIRKTSFSEKLDWFVNWRNK